MSYPTECVEAFEREFKVPEYLYYGHRTDVGDRYTIREEAWQNASMHSHAKMIIEADNLDQMLAAFAHNWERCRRLEES